jgi:serine phosphatase RsbU (regulator of sigma subunit)
LLKVREVQEREATEREVSLVKHTDDDHFVLNLAAFHNFTSICCELPRSFMELKLLILDRVAFHKQVALKAQRTRNTQRAQTAARWGQGAGAKRREAAEAGEAARQAELALGRGDEIDKEENSNHKNNQEAEEVEIPEEGVDNERGRCGRKRRRCG